jgi:hypothetical protein
MHFQGYGLPAEEFWRCVYACCAEKYDMGAVERIWIYGDGGGWIQKGMEAVFPGAEHVLDAFHYRKALKSLLGNGWLREAHGHAVHSSILHDRKGKFEEAVGGMEKSVIAALPEGAERDARLERLRRDSGYILNFWEAIQRLKRGGHMGSCTEGMVSHVLSERLSRSPMGWSREGLAKAAEARVYVKNGERIAASDVGAGKGASGRAEPEYGVEKYKAAADRQQAEILSGFKGWGWLRRDWDGPSGKLTGTKAALDALGRTRGVS